MLLSLIIVLLVSLYFWRLFILKAYEKFIVLSLCTMVFIGFINRLAMFFWRDHSGVLQYLNLTIFIPLFFYSFKTCFYHLHQPRIAILLIFYLCVMFYCILGFLNSPIGAIYDLATYGIFVGTVLFVYQTPLKPETLLYCLMSYLVPISAIMSVYAISQFLLGPNELDRYWMNSVEFSIIGIPEAFLVKTFALTASPGHLASFCLVIQIFLLSLLAFGKHQPYSSTMIWSVLVLNAVALFFTGVRSVFFMHIVFLCIYFFSIKGLLQSLIIIPVVYLLLIFSMNWVDVYDLDTVVSRITSFSDVLDGEDHSLQARLHTLNLVATEIFDNPFGYGLGRSGRFGSETDLKNIDNGYIEMLYELGIFSLLVWCAFLLVNLSFFVRSRGFTDYHGIANRVASYSTMAIMCIMLFGNVVQLNMAIFFAVFFGLAAKCNQQQRVSFQTSTRYVGISDKQ